MPGLWSPVKPMVWAQVRTCWPKSRPLASAAEAGAAMARIAMAPATAAAMARRRVGVVADRALPIISRCLHQRPARIPRGEETTVPIWLGRWSQHAGVSARVVEGDEHRPPLCSRACPARRRAGQWPGHGGFTPGSQSGSPSASGPLNATPSRSDLSRECLQIADIGVVSAANTGRARMRVGSLLAGGNCRQTRKRVARGGRGARAASRSCASTWLVQPRQIRTRLAAPRSRS